MNLYNDVLSQRDSRIPKNVRIADYVRSGDCAIEGLDDATLVVVARQGEMFELDLVAAIMFEEILLGEPVADPVAHLATIFDNSEPELREFYAAFEGDMEKFGLVDGTEVR